MPTFYDYFRTFQEGKSCGGEYTKNPIGSCPEMGRQLYIDPSIRIAGPGGNKCEQLNDEYGKITSIIKGDESDETWRTNWIGGKCPSLCGYDKDELNYVPRSGVKLLYCLEKKIRVLPEHFYLFYSKCINPFYCDNVTIYLTFGRLYKCGKYKLYYSEPGKFNNYKNVIEWKICSDKTCRINFFSFDICFPKQGKCSYVPTFELSFEEFNTDLLNEWFLNDYDVKDNYKDCTSSVDKAFFYNSKLALNGALLAPAHQNEYYPINYREANYKKRFNRPDSGIPGPFPFYWPIEQWDCDTQYAFGKLFYNGMITHWKQNVIWCVCDKINILLRDKHSPTKSQDKLLDHLTSGITRQLLKITGLIDEQGNPIEFGDPQTPKGKLMIFLNQIITGKDVPCDGFEIESADSLIRTLIGLFAPTSQEAIDIFEDTCVHVCEILHHHNLDKKDYVPFLPWNQLVRSLKIEFENSFRLYKKFYRMKKCDSDYCRMKDLINKHTIKILYLANQFSAFFSILYIVVAVMDVIHDEMGKETEPAIPIYYRRSRVRFVNNNSFRFWKQQIMFFDDYCKAASLCREDDMYRSQLNLLESIVIGSMVESEVFRAWDHWIRQRNGYNELIIT
jgi:hypothetical protein